MFVLDEGLRLNGRRVVVEKRKREGRASARLVEEARREEGRTMSWLGRKKRGRNGLRVAEDRDAREKWPSRYTGKRQTEREIRKAEAQDIVRWIMGRW